MVGNGNGMERTLHVQAIHGNGEFVVGRAHVGSLAHVLAAGFLRQAPGLARRREPDVLEQRSLWILDVGNLINRHPQLVMRAISLHGDIPRAHAHDVSE